MVSISIESDSAIFEVLGMDRLWSFHTRIRIPLADIKSVRTTPDEKHGWWKGLRIPGTQIPGVITAGVFHHRGKRTFYDMHDPSKTIAVELENNKRFDRLIVEVRDPEAAVEMLEDAVRRKG